MAHVPYPEGDEIAAAQLAVDPQVEEGKLAHPYKLPYGDTQDLVTVEGQ